MAHRARAAVCFSLLSCLVAIGCYVEREQPQYAQPPPPQPTQPPPPPPPTQTAPPPPPATTAPPQQGAPQGMPPIPSGLPSAIPSGWFPQQQPTK